MKTFCSSALMATSGSSLINFLEFSVNNLLLFHKFKKVTHISFGIRFNGHERHTFIIKYIEKEPEKLNAY